MHYYGFLCVNYMFVARWWVADRTSRIAFRTSRCHPLLVPGQLTKKVSFEHCEGLVILKKKNSSSPRMTEQKLTLERRLECISRDLKVLWLT